MTTEPPWQTRPQNGPQAVSRRWPTVRQSWPGRADLPADPPRHRSGQQTGAGLRPVTADGADRRAERLATFSYLSVPCLGPAVPLAVCLLRRRASACVRGHSAQALNLAVTALLYGICVLILGGMLALDSLAVALVVAVPVGAALWLVTLTYAFRAGLRASQGGDFRIPSWLCATIVR